MNSMTPTIVFDSSEDDLIVRDLLNNMTEARIVVFGDRNVGKSGK